MKDIIITIIWNVISTKMQKPVKECKMIIPVAYKKIKNSNLKDFDIYDFSVQVIESVELYTHIIFLDA